MPDLTHRLNATLDRIVRTTVWSSGRPVPAYRAAGVVGFYAATALTLVGAVMIDRPMVVAVAMGLTCAATFFGWGWLRATMLGHADMAMLEHVWLATAACTLVLAALDEPVWAWLDVVAVGLCAFLACGRLGCAMVGCCHGMPSDVGVTYPPGEHRVGGLRLFPLQLVEAIVLATLAAGGLAALGRARPGDVVLAIGAVYAVARFGTEGLRGDPRPRWLGVTQARAMAGAQLVVVLVADEWRGDEVAARRVVPVAAGLLAVAVCGLVWRRDRPLSPEVIDRVRRASRADAGEPVVVTEAGEGVTVGAGIDADGRHHVSVAVAGEGGTEAAARVARAAFGADPDVVSAAGVAHRWVAAPQGRTSAVAPPTGQTGDAAARRRYFDRHPAAAK